MRRIQSNFYENLEFYISNHVTLHLDILLHAVLQREYLFFHFMRSFFYFTSKPLSSLQPTGLELGIMALFFAVSDS